MGFPGGDDVISDTCGGDDVYLEFSDGITCGFFNEVDWGSSDCDNNFRKFSGCDLSKEADVLNIDAMFLPTTTVNLFHTWNLALWDILLAFFWCRRSQSVPE